MLKKKNESGKKRKSSYQNLLSLQQTFHLAKKMGEELE